MTIWHDFLQGVLPYQSIWLPLAIGAAAGMLCVFVGTRVSGLRKRRAGPKMEAISTGPNAGYDPFVQGSLLENRKSLRRAGNPVVVHYATPENKKVPRRALVLDRSIGGLRLGAEEEVAAGTIISVLPANASESTPWIEVEVRTVREIEDCWELGCQFVKTPQWSILLMFG